MKMVPNVDPFQGVRDKGGWVHRPVEWTEDDVTFLSVIFSWDLSSAYQRAIWLKQEGKKVRAGGPAVLFNPDYMAGVAELGGVVNALPRHNPNATFTSRGCIRQCKFCAVPTIEGSLVELTDWEPKPIVCDNNLLACSIKHFDSVIDKLKPLKNIDFNQGLDARLLTKYHAERLAELDCKVRFAWDYTPIEKSVFEAIELVVKAGIAKRNIGVYVLFGFQDTPEDALYRLQTLFDYGIWPNPMRYQPLGALKKNNYVGEHWTRKQLSTYTAYWSALRYYAHIPFAEYRAKKAKGAVDTDKQPTLF